MNTRTTLVLVGLVLGGSASGVGSAQQASPPPPAPQVVQAPPVFKSAVDLVSVDVSVVDQTGRPVRDLASPDFRLTVDGHPRQVASLQFVSQETRPGAPLLDEPGLPRFSTNQDSTGGRLILIVIDQGNIGVGSGRVVMETISRFLSRLGPGDRAGLAVLPGGMVVNFTRHLALVRDAVGKVAGTNIPIGQGRRIGLSEALGIDRTDTIVLQTVLERECGSPYEDSAGCSAEVRNEARRIVVATRNQAAMSLTALRSLMSRLTAIEGQKTLILVSEGLVIGRDFDNLAWVEDETGAARATIHALRIIPPLFDVHDDRLNYAAEFDQDLAARGLDMLVGKSRGAYYSVIGPGQSAFDRLSLEMTGYYLIGFEPEPSDRNGKTHSIDVRVARPGVTVRARRQFTAPPPTAARPADDDILKSMLVQPLLAGEIPIKVTTLSYKDPESEKIKLMVAASIGRPNEFPQMRALGFSIVDDEGQPHGLTIETAPPASGSYLGAALVGPGTYTLRLAVIDDQGRRGSVEHRFGARLRVGGPFRFGDLMLADGEMGTTLQPKIEPRVSRQTVLGYTEIYASDPARFQNAAVTFEVARDPNARTLAQATGVLSDTANPGRRLVQGSVPTTGLEPGDYVLRAVVTISGRAVARLTQSFTLISATTAPKGN